MKNKMLWLLSLVLALLLLTGCFMPKQNKALESKLMEAESKVLNLENQVALMVQNLTDSQNEVLKLQSEQSAKDEKILQLESQLEEAEKNFKAKRSIRVVDDTPGVTSTAPDNKSELRELKGHSLIERIAGNLSARRAAN